MSAICVHSPSPDLAMKHVFQFLQTQISVCPLCIHYIPLIYSDLSIKLWLDLQKKIQQETSTRMDYNMLQVISVSCRSLTPFPSDSLQLIHYLFILSFLISAHLSFICRLIFFLSIIFFFSGPDGVLRYMNGAQRAGMQKSFHSGFYFSLPRAVSSSSLFFLYHFLSPLHCHS